MTNHLLPDEFAEAIRINTATVYRWLRSRHVHVGGVKHPNSEGERQTGKGGSPS